MSEQKSDRVFLGGLWENSTRDGKPYLSGSLGAGGKLLAFPNGYKQKPSDPDWKLYIVPKPPKDDAPRGQAPPDDEIPF